METIWRSMKATHLEKLFINPNSIIGWVLIILGIVNLMIPDYAYRAFGGIVGVFVLDGVVIILLQLLTPI